MRFLFKTSDVYGGNRVDVQSPDGILQHGNVIDAKTNGLIIDFGGREQRWQFVEYGTVSHCLTTTGGSTESPADLDTVVRNLRTPNFHFQVLGRPSADESWRWYSVDLLGSTLFGSRYVAVEIRCDLTIFREVIPAHLLRAVPSIRELQQCRVEVGDFSPGHCSTLGHYAPAHDNPVMAPLWNCWQEQLLHRNIVPVRSLTNARVELEKLMSDGWIFSGTRWRSPTSVAKEAFLSLEHNPLDPEPLSSLSLNVLEQLFPFLDTVHRVQCRRVCPLWDSLINQANPSHEIQISFATGTTLAIAINKATLMVGQCLCKCMTSTTERVIIMNASYTGLNACLRLIVTIQERLSPTPEKKMTVIINKFVWKEERPVWNKDATFTRDIASMSYICSYATDAVDRLMWRNCEFPASYPCGLDKRSFCGVLHLESNCLHLQCHLWDMLETSLAASAIDPDLLSEWIRDAETDCFYSARIKQVLDHLQICDPRIKENQPEVSWTLYPVIDLDLSSLSKLTLCALHGLMIESQLTEQQVVDKDKLEVGKASGSCLPIYL
ncbi:uncharacterized protein LOC129601788 isoform X2 [Paramacrobiotus metropolitanus]|uniref:uncharacterized protein LOC129601788 isoform X2 n=1 Tax=Paramacrobiotus metropolitanus TaxID=2943436 RepID=UPI0024461D55|nr:uncharacterized protein LOC129601788 isoform X2 [Paramacrobiotus metropolitanus]